MTSTRRLRCQPGRKPVHVPRVFSHPNTRQMRGSANERDERMGHYRAGRGTERGREIDTAGCSQV